MMAEISIGLQSLRAMTDLVKVLNAASTQTQINEVKLGLQSGLLEAQQALFAAQTVESASANRIRDLEQEVVKLKDWDAEKQRYRLADIDGLAFVYSHRPGMEAGEPAHWLCQKCFREGRPSTLQFFRSVEMTGRMGLLAEWRCNSCSGAVMVKRGSTPQVSEPDEPEPEPRTILPD